MPGFGYGFKIGVTHMWANFNHLINWGFWSLDNNDDYYVSIEEGTPYYSLTEKE